jgi:hypothetical protein
MTPVPLIVTNAARAGMAAPIQRTIKSSHSLSVRIGNLRARGLRKNFKKLLKAR